MSITNRSAFVVTVARQPARTREFSFPKKREAQAYLEELRTAGVSAKLSQLENSWQLRLRYTEKSVLLTFNTRAEAEKTLAKIESDRALSIFRDYSAATRITVRELLERYRDEVCPGHKGAEPETYRINKLVRDEQFVEKRLSDLSTEDLQDFITDRLSEVAPSTVDRELDLLSQALKYAADVWKVAASESPFLGLRRPKYFNERDRRLCPAEEAKLLKAARADQNECIEAVIIIALATAMRRSEILGLAWSRIDFEGRSAFLPESKNGRPRSVPLSARAIAVLAALPRTSDVVFNVSPNALKKAFVRIRDSAGFEDLHFHDLRHEAISRLAESGKFALLDLQAISGHRDVRMLLRYTHLCVKQLAERMDLMPTLTREYEHKGRRRRVFKVIESSAEQSKELQVQASNAAQVPGVSIGNIPEKSSATNVVFATLGTAVKRMRA